MKLNEEQINQFKDELSKRWDSTVCNFCSQKDWDILDTTLELQEYQNNEDVIIGEGARKLPLIVITCKNCGITHLIDPEMMGINTD